MLIEYWLENKMKNNLLKNLTASFVIVFTVGLSNVWAQEVKSKLPKCKVIANSKEEEKMWNSDSRPRIWNNCFGTRVFSNGDKYVGEFKGGDFSGRGILTTTIRKNYDGEWREHKKNGQGTSNWGDMWKYVGEHKDGLFNGRGTLTNLHGETYVGDWTDGHKNGLGTLTFENRDKYEGEWQNDEMHGQGIFIFADGGKYVGEFKYGERSGRGIETKADGRKFEGVWENNDFIREEKVNLSNLSDSSFANADTETERQQVAKTWVNEKLSAAPTFNIAYPTKSYLKARKFSEGLAPVLVIVNNQRKWGYVDINGAFAIPPQFDSAESFSEGLARVRVGAWDSGKYGFIDKSGKFKIEPNFDHAEDFSDGMAIVSRGITDFKKKIFPKYGAINTEGQLVIDYEFNLILTFREGLAPAILNTNAEGKEKWGYIDRNGIQVIKPIFDFALVFSEGKAIVGIKAKNDTMKYGFVDKKGNLKTIPLRIDGFCGFKEGLACVGVKQGANTKVGFIDGSGSFVIAPIFDAASDFSEGLAAVQIGNSKVGTLGFIDKSGAVVIKPNFNYSIFPSSFKEGMAAVEIGEERDSRFGFIDKKGNFLFPPKYKYANNFSEGFAIVFWDEGKDDWEVGFLKLATIPQIKFSVDVSVSKPDENGIAIISVRTSADTSSLKINGEEQGGRSDGKYSVKKIARAGGDTQFSIVATDTNGNTDTKTITVSRPLKDSKPLVAALNPAQVKRQPERDTVAIIIGIADYKNLPRADYANDDARVFYDYAIRALGVKPENIKLLVDADADEVGIYRAFKTWLPSRVRASTDVYVYYSGHGLPTADGRGLYMLPQRADRDFIDKTAITQAEINAAIQAAKPKSVTVFLDACFSGQARTGETLLASARPVSLKTETAAFPEGFTVITASRGDQISSSSPELKHGIFSYYLMRGMEGDADINKDGKITTGEMHSYLLDNVTRQASLANRVQHPQLAGDANRVLVGQ